MGGDLVRLQRWPTARHLRRNLGELDLREKVKEGEVSWDFYGFLTTGPEAAN
jgi:hypothetical protein